jgi:peptidoglycan/LPS O-acetylase OafA/YrhL
VFQFVPYPKGSFSWHHLWFIIYLLVYSIGALPILLWLRKTQAQKFLRKLVILSSKKGGILLWVIPIVISQSILRPIFVEETHALINDWAYFTFYFLFFLFGYIAFSCNTLWLQLKEQRRFNLVASSVMLAVFYLIYFIPYKLPVHFDFPWMIAKVLVAWFWVVTFIGYGQQYLKFNNELLKYANEAIYPFYILHQTVIIAIGYYVIKWNTGILVKYSVVVTLTFLVCLISYEFFIKRFAISRLLFGMKPLTKEVKTTYQLSGSNA